MLRITFTCFSPILNKTFTNVEIFEDMARFRTYAYALYSGNWEIVSTETI